MSILLRTADRRLDQYCLPTESIAKLGVKKIEVSIFRIRNKGKRSRGDSANVGDFLASGCGLTGPVNCRYKGRQSGGSRNGVVHDLAVGDDSRFEPGSVGSKEPSDRTNWYRGGGGNEQPLLCDQTAWTIPEAQPQFGIDFFSGRHRGIGSLLAGDLQFATADGNLGLTATSVGRICISSPA